MGGGAPTFEQPGRAADQRPRAHREQASIPTRLIADPGEDLVVVHQRFLAEAARYVQKVELRRFRQNGVRRQSQAAQVPHRRGALAINPIGGIRNTRQNFEGPRQIDLVQSLEQQRTDLEVSVPGDHDAKASCGLAMDKASLSWQALAEMPKYPRFRPKQLPRVIELLAYPRVQLLDVAGPLQVFASANELAASHGEAPLYAPRVVSAG